jgi:hypothetical protein
MDRLSLALLCGLGFGAVTVLLMLFAPVKFDTPRQKQEALVAAFIGRFMNGFLIPLVDIGLPPVMNGILISLGLSLSPAIMSRRYVPILIIGILGGAIIGWIAG